MTTNFGFLATNGSNQVLISSKTKNLHFLGKATYYSTLQSTNGYGGIRRWTFRITAIGIPVPFFSMPTTDKYAIVRMTLVGSNLWEIEILRSGTSDTMPEVYVFTEVTSEMKPVGSWGMQVLNETSGISYDSRLKPLIVKGGISVLPPYDPMNALPFGQLAQRSCATDGAGAFISDKNTNTVAYNTNLTKPIYSYQSISQTMRQVVRTDQEYNCWPFGYTDIWPFPRFCIGVEEYHYWESTYWAFWRAGISGQQSGAHTSINCGWIAVDYGCHRYEHSDSNVLGIVSFGGNSSVSGNWPFTNLTINYNSVPIILADAKYYD